MSDTYRYFGYDINANSLLCEVPITGNPTFDTRLNDAGSFSGSLHIGSPAVANQAANVLAYNGLPFKLVVDRDGVIEWCGIVQTGTYSKSTDSLDIGGKEITDYFSQRIAVADYSQMSYPTGIDPAQLAYKIYADAQNTSLAGPGASIGITIISTTSSLPLMVPGYPSTQSTMVQSIAEDIVAISAPGVGGLDISTQTAWVGGVPSTTIQPWSPRVGRAAGVTGLIFDLTTCIDFTWPTDATNAATTVVATGSGTGAAIPAVTVQTPGVPVGGLGQLPRLDKVISFQNVQSEAQLALMANGAAQQYAQALTTPTITVPTAGAQPLGSWIVGDDARIVCPRGGSPRFPNGLDQYWRIVQSAVTVPDEGVATVTLTFNLVPTY